MKAFSSALLALLLGWPLAPAAAAPAAPAVPLEVRFEVRGETGPPVPVRLQVRAEEDGKKPGSGAVTREAMAPGSVVLAAADLAGASGWQLTAEAAGYWSPRVAVFPGDTQVTVPLWPAGEVAGTVRMPLPATTEKLPTELTVRFNSSPEAGKATTFPETLVTCPVRDAGVKGAKGPAPEGTFSCQVPAGKLDLRLRARGFVSHFRWGVTVPAGKTLQTGPLALVRGASVIGRVDTAEGALSAETCKVELKPLAAGRGTSPEELERRGGLSLTAGIDPRGFFHFEGVKPGSYILSARQPGFAPAEIFPVSVLEGSESDVRQPLLLQRALTLEVILDPPLDPWNRSWVVELEQKSAVPFSAEGIGQAESTEEGRFFRKGLAPGDYWVEVQDSRGSAYASSEVTLSPGAPPLEIRLPLVWVEGEVRLGDEPLAAQLWFGGQAGRERILMRADADGEFTGVLPHGGDWEVDLDAMPPASPRVSRRVRKVAVREDKDTGKARVRIEVPNTRLAGEVVDEKGAKAPGARVSMIELETGRPAFVTADRDGRFEAAGLPEGPVTLLASVADARSDELVVNLAEGTPSPSLRLVLRKVREVQGVVASPAGGVPGARVLALPRGGAALWPAALQAITDVEGKFSLKVPAGVASLQVVVLPPGFALTQLRVDDLARETLAIPVSAQGGTLRIVPGAAAGGDPSDPASERLIVWSSGVVTDGMLLSAWAAMNGAPAPPAAPLIVPSVQPGAYVACWTDLAGAYASLQQGAPAAGLDCASGVLPAGGELTLERPGGGRKESVETPSPSSPSELF